MSDLLARAALSAAARARVADLVRGEAVTNVCAGDSNPSRHAYFVKYVVKSRKNRYGIVHSDHWAKCTDRKGKNWLTGVEVIYPGHLSAEVCAELFAPIHAAMYGPPTKEQPDEQN